MSNTNNTQNGGLVQSVPGGQAFLCTSVAPVLLLKQVKHKTLRRYQ